MCRPGRHWRGQAVASGGVPGRWPAVSALTRTRAVRSPTSTPLERSSTIFKERSGDARSR